MPPRSILFLALFFMFCSGFWSTPAAAQEGYREDILILHSYSADYAWTRTEQQGIEEIFRPFHDQYNLRIEYLDSNHNPALLKNPLLRDLYKEKFSHTPFRAILATDNAALEFLTQWRDELFPRVPVIFCGINGYEPQMHAPLQGITGVAEDNDFVGLGAVICRLQPLTERIVVYGVPDDPSHKANVALLRKVWPEMPAQLQLEVREFADLDACIQDARTNFPPRSVILMVGSMRNAAGEGINLQRANEIMSSAVDIPTYTAWDFALGHGAVGGLTVLGVEQGRLAAQLALQVLSGTPIDTLPVLRNAANGYMFDYHQLLRHGLRTDLIPPEATLLHEPDYTYRLPRESLWLIAAVFFFLTAIITLMLINIRERRAAETALVASEEKYAKAFRHCADVVGLARTGDGLYLEVSDAFFDTFGYPREEVIGCISTARGLENSAEKTFALWLTIESRSRVFDLLNAQGFVKNLEVHWCTKDGEIRIGLYSAEIILIGGESCIVYAWHDITERKRAEQALRHINDELEVKVDRRTQELSAVNQELLAMNEELQHINNELHRENTERRRIEGALEQANADLTHAITDLKHMQNQLVQSEKMAALGSLVAGISHEINTPLGVGLTAASHLKHLTRKFTTLCQSGSPRRQDLVDYLHDLQQSATIIMRNIERGAQLVRSFKQVSADQASEVQRRFDIKTYLDEILLSLQPRLKKTPHTITADCTGDLEIIGFPGAFSQIITNLIMNSLLHAYPADGRGQIRIRVTRETHSIYLRYSDDGAGMEFTTLSRIFDPFFTTRRGTGGTGLGLYIVYNIVTQQFGGIITCDSAPGAGSTFHIHLPVGKEAPHARSVE